VANRPRRTLTLIDSHEKGSVMDHTTIPAPARDDLRIEDLDRTAAGSAQFTWCIVQADATAAG